MTEVYAPAREAGKAGGVAVLAPPVGSSADRLSATNVSEIAVCQHEPGNLVYTLRAQERLKKELDGVGVAAVNQPVLLHAGGIHKNTMAATQRQDRQFVI